MAPKRRIKAEKPTRERRARASSPSSSRASTPASSKRTAGSRERLDVDERRAQLVSLGLDLFAARSYDDVSIDELARQAGVSKGLLYHYFPTKRDFYVATVHEAAHQLLTRTETSETLPPLERLRVGLDAYLDYVEAHAQAYAALMRGGVGSDPEVAKIIDDARTRMVDRLLEGLPGIPPTPLVRAAARGYVGFCEATSLDWLDNRATPRSELRDLMIEVLHAAVTIASRDRSNDAPPENEDPR
jgi:AcrR family transcriptional regulator